jgi:isopenicillin N synthase-like dioxygenase
LDFCQPIPNYFVINVDDQLQVIINGGYTSMVHRAMVSSTKESISTQIFNALPLMWLSLPQCLSLTQSIMLHLEASCNKNITRIFRIDCGCSQVVMKIIHIKK